METCCSESQVSQFLSSTLTHLQSLKTIIHVFIYLFGTALSLKLNNKYMFTNHIPKSIALIPPSDIVLVSQSHSILLY